MPASYRIAITDDHKVLTSGILDLLKILPEAHFIGAASSPEELKQLLRNQDADILILDYRLRRPIQETHELVEWLIKHRPSLKIIMYSNDDVSKAFRDASAKSIQGYVMKNDEPGELLEAIKTVAAGGQYRSSSIRAQRSLHLLNEEERIRKLVALLSDREKEILVLIVEGMKNREIAEKLNLSLNTVQTHRRNIKDKLQAKTTIELRIIAEIAGLI
ncbi:MAG: response regulator transcription factor [Haliscomenobacter sp.]|uniref:response regulator transcription factor n=1 Tax=Haliscomenobacter sp. TaxID=2717303 RepID=UPI0029A8E680|nr:response regulator transcription factor [Haliscomenobacter sp.]MDX2072645.1 response regulator transcription factor [Haliscomenobacter sp.]